MHLQSREIAQGPFLGTEVVRCKDSVERLWGSAAYYCKPALSILAWSNRHRPNR